VSIRSALPMPTVRSSPPRLDESEDLSGPLIDGFGRVHDDLRISVTDRCNLRCTYCMEEDVRFLPGGAVLSFPEIERVASVARALGVRALRITGGEPLQRRGIVDLVARLGRLGFTDLSMTTNGVGLSPLAEALRQAGLHRVNVSCDSLRPERFAAVRRRGRLDRVLAGMDAAEAAGLRPLKVNVVLLSGVNDDEVEDFARFARKTGRIVRFIEFMPLDGARSWERSRLVPTADVVRRITARWPLEPIADGGAGPAERFGFADGRGEVGFVSSVTQPFCGSCNRLRLTADGAIRNCLFSDDEISVRDVVRAGGSDADIARALRLSVRSKRAGHGINDPGFAPPVRTMSMIGG
jgi:GTP 3',8-cyclase